MNSSRIFKLLFCLLVMAGLAACQRTSNGSFADPADFYAGKKVRWIVPYSPGGGYDEYARLLSPYLEKYTGARFDILNLPGAGGMRGANELFESPRDGLTIGLINGSALVTNELAGVKGAIYKIAEFEFLGRIVADTHVLTVSEQSGIDSFEQILKFPEQVRIGATGLGGSTYVDAVIINEAFGIDVNIIHGFDSSSVIRQAMLRGNITGAWGSWGSAIDAVDDGRNVVILQSGTERHPELSDVPTVFEMADRSADPARTAAILSAWESLNAVGRPVAAPPGTPEERIRVLRSAFRSAMHDPDFLSDVNRAGRAVKYATGEEMRDIVRSATSLQPDIRQLFVKAITGEL